MWYPKHFDPEKSETFLFSMYKLLHGKFWYPKGSFGYRRSFSDMLWCFMYTQSLKFLLSISFRFAQFTHSALPRSTMDFRLPRKTHHHRWRRPLFQVIGSCKDRSSKFVLEVPKSMQTYIFTVKTWVFRELHFAFCKVCTLKIVKMLYWTYQH